MKKIILVSFIFTFLISCEINSNFEKASIENLFKELKKNSEFESELSEKILVEFLYKVDISDLKNGKSIEKEFLFEDIKCNCKDKLSISYNKENQRFELNIYEEFFEEDLDWCPESSYLFSFKFENNKISDVKLLNLAG
jgi:hypothetical protein